LLLFFRKEEFLSNDRDYLGWRVPLPASPSAIAAPSDSCPTAGGTVVFFGGRLTVKAKEGWLAL
jgi:hypothetical protein